MRPGERIQNIRLHCAERGLDDRHIRPLAADEGQGLFELLGGGAVDLIDQRHIARGELLDARARGGIQLGEAHRVHQADRALVFDMREAVGLGKQLAHARRIGQPARLDQNDLRVDVRGLAQHILKLVQTAGAEHRAAGNLVQIGAERREEDAVDALLSKFVDDQLDLAPREQTDEIFQEGRLARTEKAGDQIQPAHRFQPLQASIASRIDASSSALVGMIERYFSSPLMYMDGRFGTPILTQRATFSL